jgi:cell division protein FtsL
MSAIRLERFSQPQPQTRYESVTRSAQSAAVQTRTSIGKMIMWVVLGITTVSLANLALISINAQAIYDIRNLKNANEQMTTTAQILSEKVDSLSSQQNLSNTARHLGMVINSNPVFLRMADGKVLGKATPASFSATGRVSTNLVANSVLVETTNFAALKALPKDTFSIPKTTFSVSGSTTASTFSKVPSSTVTTFTVVGASPAGAAKPSVIAAKAFPQQVVLPSGGIPASPTH